MQWGGSRLDLCYTHVDFGLPNEVTLLQYMETDVVVVNWTQ